MHVLKLFTQVICAVSDGASCNRRFFASAIAKHKKSGVTFKAPNIALPGNFVYFICDVPHLMKTTRNAWSNSTANGTRHLEVLHYLTIICIITLTPTE